MEIYDLHQKRLESADKREKGYLLVGTDVVRMECDIQT